MAVHPRTVKLNISKGIENKSPETRTPQGYLKEQVNLDTDGLGNFHKRPGYKLLDQGDYHSLWSNGIRVLAGKGNDLVEIDPRTFLTTTLKPGIADKPIYFCYIDSTIYFVTETVAGKIVGGDVIPWGINIPSASPTATIVPNGSLGSGIYQICYTYLNQKGEESGSSRVLYIDIPANSNIELSNLPADPNQHTLRVYITHQNGRDLYQVLDLPIASLPSTVTISNSLTYGKKLRFEGLGPGLAGTGVFHFSGRVYTVSGRYLWYTQPLEYDYIDYKSNFITLDSDITETCDVESGIWVSTKTRTYFLSGRDPTSFRLTEKEPVSILPGSAIKIFGDLIQIDNTPGGYKWLVTTDRGVYALFNDGLMINLTESAVSYPKASSAASGLFEEEGISKYISLLKDSSKIQNTGVGDKISSTIIRNGIPI